MSLSSNARRLVTALAASAALGCENATGPSMAEVAGVYRATTLTTVTNGVSTDQLAAGTTLDITLMANGSTSGQFIVPGANQDGSDFVASMAGTWTLSGTTVAFQQSADTFMPAMPFVVNGDTLVGDEIFGDTRIIVILSRQSAAP